MIYAQSNHIRCFCVSIVTFCHKTIYPTARWRFAVAPAHMISVASVTLSAQSHCFPCFPPILKSLHTAPTKHQHPPLLSRNVGQRKLHMSANENLHPTTASRFGGALARCAGPFNFSLPCFSGTVVIK